MREHKYRAWDTITKRMLTNMTWKDLGIIQAEIYNGSVIPLQYTGLKDKSGKEIYEGDIIAVEGMENLPVEYIDGSFMAGDSGQYLTSYPFKVIGNIYENPELLKVKEETK